MVGLIVNNQKMDKKQPGKPVHNPLANQSGSVILLAMLILLLMTIIGISATNTSITESYIIRNVGIHKQNISMVESAALELAQDVLFNVEEPPNDNLAETAVQPNRKDYIVPDTDWEDAVGHQFGTTGMSYNDAWYDPTTTGRVIDDPDNDPTTFPSYVVPGDAFFGDPKNAEVVSPSVALTQAGGILNIRGEAADTLRMVLVGWEAAPLSSKKITKATRKRGWVRAEYISDDGSGAPDRSRYGMVRLEIGVERAF